MTYLLVVLGVFGMIVSGKLGTIAANLAGIRSAIEAQNRAYGIDATPPADDEGLEPIETERMIAP